LCIAVDMCMCILLLTNEKHSGHVYVYSKFLILKLNINDFLNLIKVFLIYYINNFVIKNIYFSIKIINLKKQLNLIK